MMLSRLGKLYITVEYFITNALMIGVVLFVFTAAVMRWAGYPLAWSVEIRHTLIRLGNLPRCESSVAGKPAYRC